MGEKKRIDILLVEKGYFASRERAKKALMSGIVFVDKQRVDKAGTKVSSGAILEVKGKDIPYVSRGGLKLEKAINKFDLELSGKTTMDVGASTGGFTDCMLQNGAKKVYSIDVGYGQLDWSLRNDDRVICMERTNIRYVKPEDIEDIIDFATIDVAFISLKLVLPVVKNIVRENGEIVFLIKPQFEAGRDKVGKKGVVRDIKIHKEVVESILEFTLDLGLTINNLTFSPITGPEGNIEFLAYAKNSSYNGTYNTKTITEKIVSYAHSQLK